MNHLDLQAAWEAWETKQARLRWKRNMFAIHYGRSREDFIKACLDADPVKVMKVSDEAMHNGVRIFVEHPATDTLAVFEVQYHEREQAITAHTRLRGNWGATDRPVQRTSDAIDAPPVSPAALRVLKERYCQLRIPFGPERDAFRERYLT